MDDLLADAGGNPALVTGPLSIDAPGTDDGENPKEETWGAGRIEPVAPERRVSSQSDPILVDDHSVTCKDILKKSVEIKVRPTSYHFVVRQQFNPLLCARSRLAMLSRRASKP